MSEMTEDEVREQVWSEAKEQVKAGSAVWSFRSKQIRLKCPHCLKIRGVKVKGEQPEVRRCKDCKNEFIFTFRRLEVRTCYGNLVRQNFFSFKKASV